MKKILSYEEFIETIKSLRISSELKGYGYDYTRKNTIGAIWQSGGRGGGSCWGSASDIPLEGQRESDFSDLELIIKHITPNLSYLQFIKLREFIKYDSFTINEYYGNYTIYSFKYIELLDLYNWFVKMKLIKLPQTASTE